MTPCLAHTIPWPGTKGTDLRWILDVFVREFIGGGTKVSAMLTGLRLFLNGGKVVEMIPFNRISVFALLSTLVISGCGKIVVVDNIQVLPSLEDARPDGSLHTPSTQSILRGEHWLETIKGLRVQVDKKFRGVFHLKGPDKQHYMLLRNIPMDQLVPRLHYAPASPPDAFDAYNLMMAEYARNSVSVPQGVKGDSMAYFETNLEESAPWTLAGDYEFIPNPSFRPLRVSVINNCLASGLWELNAVDRAGELYHAWFSMPKPAYYKLTAEVNQLPQPWVEEALAWKTDEVKVDLARLCKRSGNIDEQSIRLEKSSVGFSSQDSRRKLHKGFAMVERDDQLEQPKNLSDFGEGITHLSNFIEPGKYSFSQRKPFDMRFLFKPHRVTFEIVEPRTNYDWNNGQDVQFRETDYLLLTVHLDDQQQILIGNLPLALIVQQEDFVINGFGVGILSSSGFAERRSILIEEGHAPSFAYLVQERNKELYALNSHDSGIEQIFIRCHPFAKIPYLSITITSYERIVDLVKYEIPISEELIEIVQSKTRDYISPIFFTYRDDNLR